MIRFSAALVIVGLGLLLAGAIASNMALVYAAIAVSACAALVLVAGMIAGRDELFGRGATAAGAERTFDRGLTPGPGTAAIPGGAAGAGLRPLGGRNLAAVSAQAGTPGPTYTGVGWPDGQSPADELWARVDAELAAAGASSREPKLTKDSSPDEVWGRVEQELGGPARWNTGVVLPAAEEAVPAEWEPAAEQDGQNDWAEPAWAGRPGSDPESGIQEASVQEASDQKADAEVAQGRNEAVPDSDEVSPGRDQAVPGSDEAVPGRAEVVPDATGAAPDSDEVVPGAAGAVRDGQRLQRHLHHTEGAQQHGRVDVAHMGDAERLALQLADTDAEHHAALFLAIAMQRDGIVTVHDYGRDGVGTFMRLRDIEAEHLALGPY